jgi:hypothetical protein
MGLSFFARRQGREKSYFRLARMAGPQTILIGQGRSLLRILSSSVGESLKDFQGGIGQIPKSIGLTFDNLNFTVDASTFPVWMAWAQWLRIPCRFRPGMLAPIGPQGAHRREIKKEAVQ